MLSVPPGRDAGAGLKNGSVWYRRHLASKGRREEERVVSWFDTKVHKTLRRKESCLGETLVGTSEIKCLYEYLLNDVAEQGASLLLKTSNKCLKTRRTSGPSLKSVCPCHETWLYLGMFIELTLAK